MHYVRKCMNGVRFEVLNATTMKITYCSLMFQRNLLAFHSDDAGSKLIRNVSLSTKLHSTSLQKTAIIV
jgi:hypothetical protein